MIILWLTMLHVSGHYRFRAQSLSEVHQVVSIVQGPATLTMLAVATSLVVLSILHVHTQSTSV